MGVLASIVGQAQPAIFGGGMDGAGTEGATWLGEVQLLTEDGEHLTVDLSGTTGTCVVYTAIGGTLVATLTYTGYVDGLFAVSLDEASTAGLATSSTLEPRRCVWSLSITDGTDVVQAWTPLNSPFDIYPGV